MPENVPSKQLPHLVFGGELNSLDNTEFKDLSKLDIVGIFLQPRQEALTDVYPFYYVFDEANSDAAIAEFQQMIFLQDKSIVENQIPVTLPLDAGAEIPTRADASSVAYRRWLKGKGLAFGVAPPAAPAVR